MDASDPAAADKDVMAAEPTPLTPPAERWKQASLPELVDHLLDCHHAYTRRQLTRLSELLEEALRLAPGPSLLRAQGDFRTLARDLSAHLAEEEAALFPQIRTMAGGGPPPEGLRDVGGLFEMARLEHQATRQLLLHLGSLSRTHPPGPDTPAALRDFLAGLQELEDDLHVHIYLENAILFPRVLAEALRER